MGEIALGVILAWSGITDAKLSDVFRQLAQGKKPAQGAAASSLTAAQEAAAASATLFPSQPINAPVTGTANRAIGRTLAAAYGWGTGANWAYLSSGWQEESGWSTTAAYDHSDPYNHAYGIPQANPGTKMASAGADWKTNPVTQIRWGLNYIATTYGSPVQVPGWSADGPVAGYTGY